MLAVGHVNELDGHGPEGVEGWSEEGIELQRRPVVKVFAVEGEGVDQESLCAERSDRKSVV